MVVKLNNELVGNYKASNSDVAASDIPACPADEDEETDEDTDGEEDDLLPPPPMYFDPKNPPPRFQPIPPLRNQVLLMPGYS